MLHSPQPRDLLALVSLLFLDFADRCLPALNLRVPLRPRPPICLCKLAELPIRPHQAHQHIRNHRVELDETAPRNQFPNPPPELDNVELPAQLLKADHIFYPNFRHCFDRREKRPEMRFRCRQASLARIVKQPLILEKELKWRDLEHLTFQDQLICGHLKRSRFLGLRGLAHS
jgi:hypothetical protein